VNAEQAPKIVMPEPTRPEFVGRPKRMELYERTSSTFECWQIHSPQIGDRLYLKVLQFLFRDFAYSG